MVIGHQIIVQKKFNSFPSNVVILIHEWLPLSQNHPLKKVLFHWMRIAPRSRWYGERDEWSIFVTQWLPSLSLIYSTLSSLIRISLPLISRQGLSCGQNEAMNIHGMPLPPSSSSSSAQSQPPLPNLNPHKSFYLFVTLPAKIYGRLNLHLNSANQIRFNCP